MLLFLAAHGGLANLSIRVGHDFPGVQEAREDHSSPLNLEDLEGREIRLPLRDPTHPGYPGVRFGLDYLEDPPDLADLADLPHPPNPLDPLDPGFPGGQVDQGSL